MPGLLFRLMFVDLLKVLAVTTAVLVTVIAFGATIKPLAQDLLGPEDLLRYMALASVPMLQFALPFSAAFAGVVVFHRMANDNELLAMCASGLSWRRILLAPLALGLVLTVAMAILVDAGVPAFWTAMKRLVADELTRAFVATVDRGEAISVGDTQIYADEAFRVDPPEGSGAVERLVLTGVAAIQFSKGEPEREFTARTATVDVYRIGEDGYFKLALGDATVLNRGDRAMAGSRVVRPEAIELGRTLLIGPKGLRLLQLLALRQTPEDNAPVRRQRDALLDLLAAEDAAGCLAAAMAEDGTVTLGAGGEERWTVSGASLEGRRLRPRSGDSFTVRPVGPADRATLDASEGTLAIVSAGRGEPVRIDLTLPAARLAGSAPRPVRIPSLVLEGCPPTERSGRGLDEILAEADAIAAAGTAGGSGIAAAASATRHQVERTRHEITARIVQRAAQSLTAIAMLMAGVTFAIWLRGSLPLTIYFAAFVPAIVSILLISSGEQALKGSAGIGGIVLAFSGLAFLVASTLVAYARIARN